MSVVAARVLARSGATRMALIGNGAQAEFQALALHHLMGIREIRLFDTDPAATRKLMANLAHTGLRLVRRKNVADAVRGADIVTTVTADKTNATTLTPNMIEPGMLPQRCSYSAIAVKPPPLWQSPAIAAPWLCQTSPRIPRALPHPRNPPVASRSQGPAGACIHPTPRRRCLARNWLGVECRATFHALGAPAAPGDPTAGTHGRD
jgi:hypothetical protein